MRILINAMFRFSNKKERTRGEDVKIYHDTKEADVLRQRVMIVDLMDLGEDGQVGDKEEVVKELRIRGLSMAIELRVIMQCMVIISRER